MYLRCELVMAQEGSRKTNGGVCVDKGCVKGTEPSFFPVACYSFAMI